MNIDDLMKRPYHIVLIRDDTEGLPTGWVASVAELPGCLTQGDTLAQAAERIEEAMRLWFESQIANGGEVPAPAGAEALALAS
jgi:antitoxin HicB